MFVHVRNVIVFKILMKFILSLHLVGCGKQNLRLYQVSLGFSWETMNSRIFVGSQSIS